MRRIFINPDVIALPSGFDGRNCDELTRMVRQVAHDIRSPLSTLNLVTSSIQNVSQDKRELLKQAIRRINEIADELLKRKQRLSNARLTLSSSQLVELVSRIVSEKRAEFGARTGIKFEFEARLGRGERWIQTQPADFQRVLSNLINNAVQALPVRGRVRVELIVKENRTVIRVIDNGRGIPSEIIGKLGQSELSYGKECGTGLGLFHARRTMEAWGGILEIESEIGVATEVSLVFPTQRQS